MKFQTYKLPRQLTYVFFSYAPGQQSQSMTACEEQPSASADSVATLVLKIESDGYKEVYSVAADVVHANGTAEYTIPISQNSVQKSPIEAVSERVSSFLTALQHNVGYLVPYH